MARNRMDTRIHPYVEGKALRWARSNLVSGMEITRFNCH